MYILKTVLCYKTITLLRQTGDSNVLNIDSVINKLTD